MAYECQYWCSVEWRKSPHDSAAEAARHALMLYRGTYPAGVRLLPGYDHIWTATGKNSRAYPYVLVRERT